MIAKFAAFLCLIGLTSAGNLYGGSLGYSSDIGYGSSLDYSGYSAPVYSAPIVKTVAAAPAVSYSAPAVSYSAPTISYSAPLVTKTIAPAVSYSAPISYSTGPAVSSISQYSLHSSPIVNSYVNPIGSYAHSAPLVSHAEYSPALSYGGYGYGSKYNW